MARGNCCRLEVAAADFAEAELAYAEVVAEQEAARREREALIADFAKIQRPGASLASLLNGQPRELRELEGAVELRRRRIEAIR